MRDARRTAGSRLLGEHLPTKEARTAFAQKLGVGRATLWRWINGTRVPTVDWAFRIERETGGKVPASSWTESLRGRRGAPRRSAARTARSLDHGESMSPAKPQP